MKRVFFLFAAIYLLAWWVQGCFFLNGDVSYCLHAARLLLDGGTYARDFFNPNPPLILYLQVPALELQRWVGGNLALAFRIYVFALIALSQVLCLNLSAKLFPRGLWLAFNGALAFLLLIFPLYHFGQREHLLLIFTLPYFLLAACRLRPAISINTWQALLIGILAALGFGLKPPFLLAPLFIEVYLLAHQRRLLACLRIETLSLVAVLLVYSLSVFIFHPDFLGQVLPFVLRNYYGSVGEPWVDLLLQPTAIFCFTVLLFYFATRKAPAYAGTRAIFMLGLVACLGAHFAQQTTFFYHLLPALTFALLLLILELAALAAEPRLSPQPLWIFLGVLLLSCALPFGLQNARKGREYKEQVLVKLVQFLQTQPAGRSLYVFARWGTYAFPVVDYSASRPAARFDCLWPVVGFLKNGAYASAQQQADRDFFLNMIAEDFERQKPDFVLIDQRDRNLLAWDGSFSYPDFFSQNPRFRKEWQAYHYLTTLDAYPLYQLAVYQRRV